MHCAVVDQHIFKSDFRVVLCDFRNNFSPESGGIENVCLIDTCYFLLSLHGDLECLDRYAADLLLAVNESICRLLNTVYGLCVALTEVKASGQLADDDHVEAVTDDLLF